MNELKPVTAEQIAELPTAERVRFERWYRGFINKTRKKIAQARHRAESEADDELSEV